MPSIGLHKIKYADEENRLRDLVNKNFQTLEVALKGKLNGSNINELYLENFIADHVQAGDVLITKGTNSRVVLNENTIAMQLFENGEWVNKVYFDSILGQYVFDGSLSADVITALSAIITPNLYAEKATIAELTVDRLETGNKVGNYLNFDISDINFIRIQDQFIYFITATTDGFSTVQLEDRDSNPLYWVDDTYKSTTTDITFYPVLTYQYTEVIKQKLLFEIDPVTGYMLPSIGFGQGDGVTALSAKAQIIKGATGLWLKYWKSNTGELVQIGLTDEGIVMTDGLELSQLDFYTNGFRAKYGNREVAYRWVKDGGGRITSLTNTKTATVVAVNWTGGTL